MARQLTTHACIYWFFLLYQEALIVSYWCNKKEKKYPSLFLTDDKELQVFVYQPSVPISAESMGKYLWAGLNTLVYPLLRKGRKEPTLPPWKLLPTYHLIWTSFCSLQSKSIISIIISLLWGMQKFLRHLIKIDLKLKNNLRK